MRERSHTTPRRRGPKQPLPQDALYNDSSYETQESPYYTIDNTEDIYSTTLLPSQRCYVDPWDLENYDYVRKKIGQSPSARGYYDSSLSPSPIEEPIHHSPYYYEREPVELAPRMASTMPRNRRKSSHFQCQLECCNPKTPSRRPSGLYDVSRRDNYEDYMISHMAQKFQNAFNLEDVEQNIYRGYGGGASTSSSTEPHSSIGEDYLTSTMPRKSSIYGPLPPRKLSKPAPKLEFPAPPASVPPTYDDYCNPYATLPCCSVSDCYECLSQAQQQQQLYGSHSIYGTTTTNGVGDCYDCSPTNSLGRRPSSSLYSGIYSSKFGMSKKGLLQIDYSCSWNDLDRIMTRNY